MKYSQQMAWHTRSRFQTGQKLLTYAASLSTSLSSTHAIQATPTSSVSQLMDSSARMLQSGNTRVPSRTYMGSLYAPPVTVPRHARQHTTKLRTSGEVSTLEIMFTAADGVTERSEDHEHHTDNEHYDT